MFREFCLALLCVFAASSAVAAPGDSAVLKARQAWAGKKIMEFGRAAQDVPADHVLAPYVEYWRLTLLARHDDQRVADFLARYPGSRQAEMLRADWLKSLGARGDWERYLAEYPRLEKPETVHQCYAYRADWSRGDRRRAREAVALWFTGRDLPLACTPLFAQLRAAGFINEEDVWRRLRLALEAGNPGVARSVAQSLPESQRPAAALFDRATSAPARVLRAGLDPARRGDREIALYALDRLARSDSAEAARALADWSSRLTDAERGAAWARLGVWAARRHEAAAPAWFARAGVQGTTDSQREWWVRAALRAGDWPSVGRVIDSMSEAQRTQPVWRYWRARAALATGGRGAAMPLLLGLSREHHYYGQLAQEELGPVMAAPAINIKTGSAAIDAVAREPGIARAMAFYELGLRSDANAEWNWTIRNFSDSQLLAAAELARRAEWYDRAIHTAERTRDLHDFELRFLAPYRELAQRAAREYALDEAWVFGLMRQESRFVNVAKSSVGASGLMQIMPATARWIAGKLGIRGFQPADILDPATNIRFGAYYLSHVQTSLDGSPVLATAAYNAGPSRAQRWRDTRPMEAAIYIESIPFAETRDYVKKVMSNAMYYAARFGQPSVLLKDRLGEVPARATAAAISPEPAISLEPGPGAD
ncbi:MAG: transglycosylase SLT domain-containing protein [Thiobacillus sp.]|nr:transglycosylase SLT domain-containing protein [Thiobacillus sp.]